MKKKLQLIISVISLLTMQSQIIKAQYVIKEADVQYGLFNYSKAIDMYERAYKKKATLYTAERLAECYEKIHNYKQTESWYAIAAEMPGTKLLNILNYAKALQHNSKYSEAKAQYQKYAVQNKDVTVKQRDLWLLSCDSAMRWMKEPVNTVITGQKTLNSPQSDWGAVEYQNDIVFSSDRPGNTDKEGISRPFLKFDGAKVPGKNIYGWTGNHYLRLYIRHTKTDSVSLFPLRAGTNYHMGPANFTADGREMYFTLTRIPEKVKYAKGKLATVNIEIYSSKKQEDGSWQVPIAFKYNNVNEYSVGDPFISKDGNSLYFVSNMPGGMGGTDLYVSQKTAGGDWDLPVNLKEWNTEGNERTPSFDHENNFYFSSDGRIGMGGLDIYKLQFSGGNPGAPVNLGYPLNSPQDDFAYMQTSGSLAYLSSNRTGDDDIYSFTQAQVMAFRLTGEVPDKKTGKPLNNAIVSLGKAIRIANIYYDFDKSNISKDAAIALDKLVKIMKDNPAIWIGLESHTDSRGNDQYNEWLSQNRANSAVQYIIDKGIEKNRITAKGYGETMLLNKCANGVQCSEAEHQLNRRTVFRILKL